MGHGDGTVRSAPRRVQATLAGLLAGSAFAFACASSSGPGPAGATSQPCGTMLPDGSRAYSVRVPPEYPASAEARGESGYVALTFSIDRMGKPYNLAVVESQPPGVFDEAALRSVRQWRYCPPRGPSEGFRVELDFAP